MMMVMLLLTLDDDVHTLPVQLSGEMDPSSAATFPKGHLMHSASGSDVLAPADQPPLSHVSQLTPPVPGGQGDTAAGCGVWGCGGVGVAGGRRQGARGRG